MTEPTGEMIRQAAQWSAELATDEATDADRAACEEWCTAHPLHRIAMDRMRGLEAHLPRIDAIERKAVDRLLSTSESRRRKGLGAGLGVAALILGSWAAAQSWTVRSQFPSAETATGEQRSIALSDGALRLDTDSAIAISEQDGGTHVALYRGRILAKVDPGRQAPFVIETPEGTASALGTSFSVERAGGTTIVTVLSSQVRVCPGGRESGECMDLSPTQRAAMDGRTVLPLAETPADTAAAWSEGWLVADDRPVPEVLAEINRYRQAPVTFDAERLKHIRVSGSFPLTDTDRALEGIARASGLDLDKRGDTMTMDRR